MHLGILINLNYFSVISLLKLGLHLGLGGLGLGLHLDSQPNLTSHSPKPWNQSFRIRYTSLREGEGLICKLQRN